MRAFRRWAMLLAIAALGLGACQELPAPAAPATTAAPVAPAGSAVPAALSTGVASPVGAVAEPVAIPDLDKGRAAWQEAQCSACHGPLALGGVGPGLAGTGLAYDEFLSAVRTASPSMPASSEASLPDRAVYDIYAWLRTQPPAPQVAASAAATTSGTLPQTEQMMAMTLWTSKKCATCHGVFGQGSASAPALAGLNDPPAAELARMRASSATVPEHSPANIADDSFGRLYDWLEAGCLGNECSQ